MPRNSFSKEDLLMSDENSRQKDKIRSRIFEDIGRELSD
jgi:hypothetical protein